MRRLILAATLIGFSAGGVLAQTTGPAPQDSMKAKDTISKEDMKKDGTKATGSTTGASKADRATVPGSLNAGGTSQSSPNSTLPGASKTGH